jgi:hypothetical protein
MNLEEGLQKRITSKSDFEQFLKILIEDHKQNKAQWENPNLDRFLPAMLRWVESMENYYINTNKGVNTDNPTWDIAKGYLSPTKDLEYFEVFCYFFTQIGLIRGYYFYSI